jgi:hypothetical protein
VGKGIFLSASCWLDVPIVLFSKFNGSAHAVGGFILDLYFWVCSVAVEMTVRNRAMQQFCQREEYVT